MDQEGAALEAAASDDNGREILTTYFDVLGSVC